MQTLKQLQAGELANATDITLSENLTEFPAELFLLADTLERLDLSNNKLCELPGDFGRFTALKTLFLSNNPFSEFPAALANCPMLDIVGFKACRILHIDEDALPTTLRWLILTDNQLRQLPDNIGKLANLQKLMLAGNQLTTLPATLAQCHRLQLIRISANQLTALPPCLFALPNLCWLAFSGNPFNANNRPSKTLPSVPSPDFKLQHILGEGASGTIYQASWNKTPHWFNNEASSHIAIKLFKGQVTSDGYPEDELNACLTAGSHPHIIQTLASINDNDQSGLVMNLIKDDYINLGHPPSLATCTRDTFCPTLAFSLEQVQKILQQIASAVTHLHQQHLCHGDLYAHNILINPTHSAILGDFGAASHTSGLSREQEIGCQHIEIRAFGYLIADLLSLTTDKDSPLKQTLLNLQTQCHQQTQGITFSRLSRALG